MAIRDHTVRIRSSVPPDDTLTPPPHAPSSTAAASPETLRHSTRGDIALAVLALSRLRLDSEQCRHAQARGFPGRPLPWPLPVAVTATLGTAIHCLQQYARLLGESLTLGTLWQDDLVVFELYLAGERPSDALVLTEAKVHVYSGELVQIRVFEEAMKRLGSRQRSV